MTNQEVVRAGNRRIGGSRGAVSLRLIVALAASSVVTVAVSVPMGVQAFRANQPVPVPTPTASRTDAERTPDRPDGARAPSLALPAPPRQGGGSATGPGPAAGTPDTVPGQDPESVVLGTSITRPDPPTTTTAPPPPETVPPGSGPPVTVPSDGSPPDTSPGTTTTTVVERPRPDGRGLVWSPGPGVGDLRQRSQPLDGATLRGRVWIHLDVPTADEVRFWLDDPEGSGPPLSVDRRPPFTLFGGPGNGVPAALDTATLADGPHSVRSEIRSGGRVEVRLARFTVANR
jgi:hypothetical protein